MTKSIFAALSLVLAFFSSAACAQQVVGYTMTAGVSSYSKMLDLKSGQLTESECVSFTKELGSAHSQTTCVSKQAKLTPSEIKKFQVEVAAKNFGMYAEAQAWQEMDRDASSQSMSNGIASALQHAMTAKEPATRSYSEAQGFSQVLCASDKK